MRNRLHYYRSELKSKHIKKYKIIGISSELILSKEVFSKNEDIDYFIKNVFKIKFKPYVFKSRTLITARTTRLIYNMDPIQYENTRKDLFKFVVGLLNEEENIKHASNKESFSKWIEGILNDN